MTPKIANELLAKAVRSQREAAEQLSRCQSRGSEVFLYVRTEVMKMHQPVLAAVLGVHPTYLSKIENGKTPPGLALIEKLLNVSEGYPKE